MPDRSLDLDTARHLWANRNSTIELHMPEPIIDVDGHLVGLDTRTETGALLVTPEALGFTLEQLEGNQ